MSFLYIRNTKIYTKVLHRKILYDKIKKTWGIKMKLKMENKKGITLIALMITVIVLLILAGVSLRLITGNEGILNKAEKGVSKNKKASEEEEIGLVMSEMKIAYYDDNQNKSFEEYKKDFLDNYQTPSGGTIHYNEQGEMTFTDSQGNIKNIIINEDGSIRLEEIKKEENNVDFEQYINEHIQVDYKIYISSKTGSDVAGDGTEKKPYATLDKIAEVGIIENGYRYAIILMDGEYELTTKMFTLNCNQAIDIIGNKEKTRLKVGTLYGVDGYSSGGGSQAYAVNIYRLIWSGDIEGPNTIFLHTKLSLYNVAFDISFSSAIYSYFISCGFGCYFYNCTLPKSVGNFLRTWNGGLIRLTNCYGGFTSGYQTADSYWNYQTNYITQTPQLDEQYRITEEKSKWQNIGTDTNPDGTQANIGVYGGEFSWEK